MYKVANDMSERFTQGKPPRVAPIYVMRISTAVLSCTSTSYMCALASAVQGGILSGKEENEDVILAYIYPHTIGIGPPGCDDNLVMLVMTGHIVVVWHPRQREK